MLNITNHDEHPKISNIDLGKPLSSRFQWAFITKKGIHKIDWKMCKKLVDEFDSDLSTSENSIAKLAWLIRERFEPSPRTRKSQKKPPKPQMEITYEEIYHKDEFYPEPRKHFLIKSIKNVRNSAYAGYYGEGEPAVWCKRDTNGQMVLYKKEGKYPTPLLREGTLVEASAFSGKWDYVQRAGDRFTELAKEHRRNIKTRTIVTLKV